ARAAPGPGLRLPRSARAAALADRATRPRAAAARPAVAAPRRPWSKRPEAAAVARPPATRAARRARRCWRSARWSWRPRGGRRARAGPRRPARLEAEPDAERVPHGDTDPGPPARRVLPRVSRIRVSTDAALLRFVQSGAATVVAALRVAS